MNRYDDMTSRAARFVPARFKTQLFKGKALIYGLLALCAVAIVLVGGVAALFGDMLDGTPASAALTSAMWGAVGAATATLFALVLMPFIRDGLGLAEDIKLMRAASPEHPLMRELMSKAPGTYAHSVVAANLAEAGAEEIGADALVSRVGAYFHDVGKIRRPAYFFENQTSGENPHDEAKPSLSALIITAHVRDGMALGSGVPASDEDSGHHPPAPRDDARELLLQQGRIDGCRRLRGGLPLPRREAAVTRSGAGHARRFERGGRPCAEDSVGAARGSRRSGNHR